MAYAFLDNVIGKSMPITFLVILNINGNIINSNVIKYREAYGGEVGNSTWLQQFINRNNNSSYNIGKDINGISGATILGDGTVALIIDISSIGKNIVPVKRNQNRSEKAA